MLPVGICTYRRVGQFRPKGLGTEALRVGADHGGIELAEILLTQGSGQRRRILAVDKDPGAAVDNSLGDAAASDGYHGSSGRLGLDGGDPELLDVGDDQGHAASVEVGKVGV